MFHCSFGAVVSAVRRGCFQALTHPPHPTPFLFFPSTVLISVDGCLEWGLLAPVVTSCHNNSEMDESQTSTRLAFKFTLVICRLTLHKFYRFWLKASRPLLRRSNFAHVNTNTALYAKIVTHHQQLSGKITSMLSRH